MRTGKIVVGNVHDCNKKTFLRLLKDLDPQLYVKWNSEKNLGVGCWEVRRRPDAKVGVPKWEYKDQVFFELQYVENDQISHIMDIPALNYNVIDYLRRIDTWNTKNWVDDFEYREEKAKEAALRKNREELKYNIRFYKRAFADFQEFVRSGRNPADFLEGEW